MEVILAQAPQELIETIKAHRKQAHSLSGLGDKILEGTRNNSVFEYATSLKYQGCNRRDIEQRTREFNSNRCSPPLTDSELTGIVESCCSREAHFALSDLGNAYRLLAVSEGKLKIAEGRWHQYESGFWQCTKRPSLTLNILPRAIQNEIDSTQEEKRRKALIRHQKYSQSARGINAMNQLAESLDGFQTSLDAFDKDDHILGTTAGDVDLIRGELLPHCPSRMITQRSPIEVDDSATSPIWESFLNDTFQHDQNLIANVCKAVGYTLSGSTDEQCMFMLLGSGANGKSVFIHVVTALLGGYAIAARPGMLVKQNRSSTNDIARLKGKRLLTVPEESSNNTLDETLIKQLTAGDVISGRHLYEEYSDFRPKVKIWMTANNLPQISGHDYGIKRRIRIIPFDKVVRPEDQDPKLLDKLLEELPGIFNWALQGYQQWAKEGLSNCDAIDGATNAYLADQDPYSVWFDKRVHAGAGFECKASDVYDSFCNYCDSYALPEMSNRHFADRLRTEGFRKSRKSDGMYYMGLKLKPARRRRLKQV